THCLRHLLQQRIESELHSVFDLASEGGIRALLEAARCHGVQDPAGQLPAEGTLYAKAMWAWLHWEAVLPDATRIYQVEQLKWWRKRSDLPAKVPDCSADTLRA